MFNDCSCREVITMMLFPFSTTQIFWQLEPTPHIMQISVWQFIEARVTNVAIKFMRVKSRYDLIAAN